ncbi:MAG: hemolysin III family protein [Thermoleophilaceae bacterium]|nr:hemolysin III family protein [Thermoleophilaceae bacterium]
MDDVATLQKPRLRGVLHQYAFIVSLLAGAVLVVSAEGGRAILAASIFALSASALLGVSALYHRREWSPRARMRMRRLDHSMIFLLIAGTYTPFALLVLTGTLATAVLTIVWAGALVGSMTQLAWAESPKWIMAVICVGLGWVAAIALPAIVDGIGPVATALLALGGVLYTAGAIVYAMQRPNLVPGVFGYHELFHLLVVVAVVLQYAVVAFYVLPH